MIPSKIPTPLLTMILAPFDLGSERIGCCSKKWLVLPLINMFLGVIWNFLLTAWTPHSIHICQRVAIFCGARAIKLSLASPSPPLQIFSFHPWRRNVIFLASLVLILGRNRRFVITILFPPPPSCIQYEILLSQCIIHELFFPLLCKIYGSY